MEKADEWRLRKNRVNIIKDVRFKDVRDSLIASETLSAQDVEDIDSEKTPREKMGALLDILPRRGPDAYRNFCCALQEDFHWIVQSLQETPLGNDTEMRERVREPYRDLDHKTFSVITRDSVALKSYRLIMRGLGLPDVEMDQIEYANQRDLREQFYQSLLKWKSREGKRATVEKIINILREEGCGEAADKLDGYTE